MSKKDRSSEVMRKPISGFIAGYLATLVFHQPMLSALWMAGLAPFGPFSMAATQPFGIPVVLSLAFWAVYGASSLP
jgi:hypothetical protein